MDDFEIGVAKLKLTEHDTLVLQPPESWTPAQISQFQQWCEIWAADRPDIFHGASILVHPAGIGLAVTPTEFVPACFSRVH